MACLLAQGVKLQKTNRVKVRGPAGGKTGGKICEDLPLAGFDNDVPAVLAADMFDKGWRGAEHGDVATCAQTRGKLGGFGLGGGAGGGLAGELEQEDVRRIAKEAAFGQLGSSKAVIVVRCRRNDGRMRWRVRLDNDGTRLLAAPGSATDLGDEVEGTFAGGKVGNVQHCVGRDHAHQVKTRHVEALGNHLRAYQHVNGAVVQAAVDLVEIGGRQAVAVETSHAGGGEELAYFLLDALGAAAEVAQVGTVAGRTDGFGYDAVVAVMADKAHGVGMEGKR
jgi:hypothetical protein